VALARIEAVSARGDSPSEGRGALPTGDRAQPGRDAADASPSAPSEPGTPAFEAAVAEIRALHEARARAELAAADALAPGSDAVAWRGALMADVAVVKGLPGPAEASGGAAMSGADGEAVVKALDALGWSGENVFFTLSRSEPGLEGPAAADRIRRQIEAVDPRLVIALDDLAAADVAEGFGVAVPRCGEAARVLGRTIVAVDGFEASLGDPVRKRRVWRQLQAAKPEGPVY
jgi:hypothetical protein